MQKPTYSKLQRLGVKTMLATSVLAGAVSTALPLMQSGTAVVYANTGRDVSAQITSTGTINNLNPKPSGSVNTGFRVESRVTGDVKEGDYVDFFFENVPANAISGQKITDGGGAHIGTLKVTATTTAFDKQVKAPLSEKQALNARGTNTVVRFTFGPGVNGKRDVMFAFIGEENQTLTVVSKDKEITQNIYKGATPNGAPIATNKLTIAASESKNPTESKLTIVPDKDIHFDGDTYTPKQLFLNIQSAAEKPITRGSKLTISLPADSSIRFDQAKLASVVGKNLVGTQTRSYFGDLPSNANNVVVFANMDDVNFKVAGVTANKLTLEAQEDIRRDATFSIGFKDSFALTGVNAKTLDEAHSRYKGVKYFTTVTSPDGAKLGADHNVVDGYLNIFGASTAGALNNKYSDVRMEYRLKKDDTVLWGSEFVARTKRVGTQYDATANQKQEVVWENGRKFRPTGEVKGAVKGQVAETVTTLVQYFEEVTGNVTVKSQTEGGLVLEGPAPVVTNAPLNSNYSAPEPKSVISHGGKQYRLKTKATLTGKVTEAPIELTHIYEEVNTQGGQVTVRSVEKGTNKVLIPSAVLFDNKQIGEDYAAPDAPRMIFVDGKSYLYTDTTNNKTGRITAQPIEITHTYKEVTSSVHKVSVDENGDVLVPLAPVVEDAPIGSGYNAGNPDAILKVNGKTYKYVETTGDLNGQVEEKPKTITNHYKEIKGSVTVTIEEEGGNVLVPKETVISDKPVDDPYKVDEPKEMITVGGKTYKFVRSTANKEGQIIEGVIDVVHTYKEIKGSVTVESVSTTGEVLIKKETVLDGKPVGDKYETATPTPTITVGNKTYKYVRSTPNTKGDIIEGVIDVVHTYEEVKDALPNTGGKVGISTMLAAGLLGLLALVGLGSLVVKFRKKA